MKRVFLKLLSISILPTIIAIYPIKNIYAADLSNSEQPIAQVKETISQYFNNEYDSIKKGQAVSEDNIISNDKLKQLTNLKYSREAQWYQKLGDELSKYYISIDYNSINFDNDICTADLSKNTEFSFKKKLNITSKESGVKHVIKLKKINGKFLIDTDTYKEDGEDAGNGTDKIATNYVSVGDSVSENNIDKKIESMKESLKNVNSDAKEFNKYKENIKANLVQKNSTNSIFLKTTIMGRSFNSTYSWGAAVDYALTWAQSRNPQYPSYDSDCANFASQCVCAGAPATSSSWYALPLLYSTPSWRLVIDQGNYFDSNTGIGPVGYTPNIPPQSDEPQPGDVIQLWNKSAGCLHHSVVVTDYDLDSGTIYYCAHTTDRYKWSLDSAYATGLYDHSRQKNIHILGYNK